MVVLLLQTVTIITVNAATFGLDISRDDTNQGQLTISWKNYYDYRDKYFRIYRQTNGTNFEQIQIDYTDVDQVYCLQVWPMQAAKDQMRKWTEQYDQGKITVYDVSIEQFNSNPQLYLKDKQHGGAFDNTPSVIFFGTWDVNGDYDLTENQQQIVEKHIQAGKGAIFGHDTIANILASNLKKHTYFNRLAQYVNVQATGDTQQPVQNQVRLEKHGLLNTYPNSLGSIGKVFTIPEQHTVGQLELNGQNVWMRFLGFGNSVPQAYLQTWNNCALIQTGHSSTEVTPNTATPDEQKILTNTIFYCHQLLFEKNETKDWGAMDYAAPNTPQINTSANYNGKIVFYSKDNGQKYWYYVDAYDKNDVDFTGKIARQQTVSEYQITGTRKFLYKLDNNANTQVNTSNGISVTCNYNSTDQSGTYYLNQNLLKGYKYLHVAAVDGAGNISGTAHMPIQQLEIKIIYNKNSVNAVGNVKSQSVGQIGVNLRYNGYTLDKYKFIGWNTKSNGTGYQFKENQYLTRQYLTDISNPYLFVNLYAQWTPLYKLQVDPNKGNWTNPITNYTQKNKQEIWLAESDSLAMMDPTRTGYNFRGWIIGNVKID